MKNLLSLLLLTAMLDAALAADLAILSPTDWQVAPWLEKQLATPAAR